MWYAIVTEDTPNSLEKRLANRPAHLARLTALQEAGRLLLAGPFPAIDSLDPGPAGFTGSLIVAEFNTLAEAETWASVDPFVSAGVYALSLIHI
jgi:uncharacterized protein YciI